MHNTLWDLRTFLQGFVYIRTDFSNLTHTYDGCIEKSVLRTTVWPH